MTLDACKAAGWTVVIAETDKICLTMTDRYFKRFAELTPDGRLTIVRNVPIAEWRETLRAGRVARASRIK